MEYIDNSAIAAIIIAILGTFMARWIAKSGKEPNKKAKTAKSRA